MRINILLLCIIFFYSHKGIAQSNWLGTIDENWNNPLNWEPLGVPDSFSNVNIILNASNPQTHWPALQGPTSVGTVSCRNGSINFNGFKLRAIGFGGENAILLGNSDTSQIEMRTYHFGISLKNSEVIGDFIFSARNLRSTGQGVWIKENCIFRDDLLIKFFDVGTSMELVNCSFQGNITFEKENLPVLLVGGPIRIYDCNISGSFNYRNLMGGPLQLGRIGNPVTVQGKVNLVHSNYPGVRLGPVQLGFLSNSSAGGRIEISRVITCEIQNCNLKLDSLIVLTDSGRVTIDSCIVNGNVRLETGNSILTPVVPSRISSNTFNGNFSWTDFKQEMQETRGGTTGTAVFGGPNNYLGDAYFEGMVNLGFADTSNFHRNLTILPLQGSTYHRARFTGDQVSEVNIGDTIIQYMIVEKNGAGYVNLTGPLHVSGFMRFDHGRIHTSNGSYLKFLPGSTAENFGDHSYVNGLVQKEGNSSFVFPTGSIDQFKPLFISAPAEISEIVSVQYHHDDVSAITDTASKAAGLTNIGNCEYWEVEQLNGSNNLTIAASWNQACLNDTVYFSDPTTARITRWNGNQWQDEGNGNYSNGFISSATAITPNGLFTFASPLRQVIIPNPNPEPIPPSMIVYPNPATYSINVFVESDYKKGIIIDAIGRTISIHRLAPGLNNINVESLPSGVYFLKLINKRMQKVLKWVKL